MKKIIYSILIVGLVSLAACDKFLEEDVRGIISPDNFYRNDNDAILAANGIYNRIMQERCYNNWNGYTMPSMFGSDEVTSSRKHHDWMNGYTLSEFNTAPTAMWKNSYGTVNNANSVIANVENNENISEEVRNQVIGEALFLKSLAYYHIVNTWGDAPFMDKEISLEEMNEIGRTDETIIRDACIGYLQRIIDENLLPDVVTEAAGGRATVWAARILKAKFHLWKKEWVEAKAECDAIIAGPHTLMPTFADVFAHKDNLFTYNNEIIFGFDWLADIWVQHFVDGVNPRLTDEPAPGQSKKDLKAALADNNHAFTGYGLTVPTPDLVEKFPLDDPRRELTCCNEYEGIQLRYVYFKKFWSMDQEASLRQNHGDLMLVFRLADAYLMAAEAENEMNGPAGAYTYINTIRERAYGDATHNYSGMSQDELRQAIRDERRWELAAEFHRRYDLIRWGILVETIQNMTIEIEIVGNVTVTYRHPWHDVVKTNIQPHHVKLPLPWQEIELNENLLTSDPTNNGYR